MLKLIFGKDKSQKHKISCETAARNFSNESTFKEEFDSMLSISTNSRLDLLSCKPYELEDKLKTTVDFFVEVSLKALLVKQDLLTEIGE